MKILVTGANGQLGHELMAILDPINSHFYDKSQFDITNIHQIEHQLSFLKVDIVINCAAYTAVDKAESEKELCKSINVIGARNLATICKKLNIKLIHVSTDFVFDGEQCVPYHENDATNPLSVYGLSKLNGEREIMNILPSSIIIRTSWLYSSFGKNFVKTIIRLCKERERERLSIVVDQIGTPTYAADLALAVNQIIAHPQFHSESGIFHFSNQGVCSWYDLAVSIAQEYGFKTEIIPIQTNEYPTHATRPKYSVFNTKKIKSTFNLEIPHWQNALKRCVLKLKKDE